MSLVNINGNIEIINDQCSQDSITEMIRQYMGDDMAEYVERAMKFKDEQNEELLDELKSAGEDLHKVKKKADNMDKLNGMISVGEMRDVIDNVYENIFDKLFGEYGIQV